MISLIISVIAASVLGREREVIIPKETFPIYGTEEQSSAGGWVQLNAVSAVFLCTAEYTTSITSNSSYSYSKDTKKRNGYTTYHNLYYVQDDRGNNLIVDLSSFITNDHTVFYETPALLYGRLDTIEHQFHQYDGYEKIQELNSFDLLLNEDVSKARRSIVSPVEKTIKTLLLYIVIPGLIIAFVIILVTEHNKRKKELKKKEQTGFSEYAQWENNMPKASFSVNPGQLEQEVLDRLQKSREEREKSVDRQYTNGHAITVKTVKDWINEEPNGYFHSISVPVQELTEKLEKIGLVKVRIKTDGKVSDNDNNHIPFCRTYMSFEQYNRLALNDFNHCEIEGSDYVWDKTEYTWSTPDDAPIKYGVTIFESKNDGLLFPKWALFRKDKGMPYPPEADQVIQIMLK